MSAPSHVGHLALVAFAALVALVALSPLSLGGCGRRDDGSIAADPDAKLRAGFPVIYVAPPVPTNPGAPAPSNPLAMNALKHDAPASRYGCVVTPIYAAIEVA